MLVGLYMLVADAAEVAATDGGGLLAAYEAVRVPLVEDEVDGAREAAGRLAADPAAPRDLAAAARAVADTSDPATARAAFAELSRILVLRFEATGAPDGTRVYRCPMVAHYAYWLQAGSGLANPYMGTSMPGCGEGTSFKAAAKAAEKAP